MSVSAAGGISASAASPYQSSAAPQEKSAEEITTVTTHCDKKHEHTPACPHTTSTRPVPPEGEPGHLLDVYA